jgi:Zn-finger nucleic acid-binding protein
MGMIAVICERQTKSVRGWLDGDNDENLQAMQRILQPDDYKAQEAHVDRMLKMHFRRELSEARKLARGARQK